MRNYNRSVYILQRLCLSFCKKYVKCIIIPMLCRYKQIKYTVCTINQCIGKFRVKCLILHRSETITF